ncbi:MAG TPA: hypothetical protein V6D37_07075 [Candidatus Sericytochromatia bacterium]
MGTGRVFFGYGVETILSKADCPVAVITSSSLLLTSLRSKKAIAVAARYLLR